MSKETERCPDETSSSPLARQEAEEREAAVRAFVRTVTDALGPHLTGVSAQYGDKRRVGFLTYEGWRATVTPPRWVDTIIDCATEAGLHVNVLPFPFGSGILYECEIRRKLSELAMTR